MEQHIIRVAIAGAGGFIGSALKEYLRKRDCSVISLSRKLLSMSVPQLVNLLEGTDVIINLAGSPIVGRWTPQTKSAIYASRILTTRKLASAILAMKSPPDLFISGSAVGIYNEKGNHTEDSQEISDGFLGKLCQDWEAEALAAKEKTRVILLRTGVVLGKEGGALAKMLPLFRAGLGGVVASGNQGFSWIHMNDLINAIEFLISKPELSGVFNLTAPGPIDNRSFTKHLARTLNKGAFLPVPEFMLRLIYGEGAKALTEGQFVYPEKLITEGFSFEYPNLEAALSDILNSGKQIAAIQPQ
jgi:uncharacterized protein